MRTWALDQWEFEYPDSEESLEVAMALRSDYPFPDVREFIATAVGESALADLPEPQAFDSHDSASHIRGYLSKYCGIDIPAPCDWPSYRIMEDRNSIEWHVVICTPTGFIRAFWMSTA